MERTEDTGGTEWHLTIKEELQAVEDRLLEAVGSDVPTVSEISKHLLSAGGKRLRPALVVLSAGAALGSVPSERLSSIGATVELIHMASLVHDDVIDDSNSRRGRATANACWGNKVSILSGDCMLAKAFHYLACDGDQRIIRVIADMTVRMSESEVLQAICERQINGWRRHYWHIIRHKTAGFLSACCRCGAILAGASSELEDTLAQYGVELGMAFQLTDDLLDIVGEPGVTGKPVGSDLRDGKVTLPVLLALDGMSEEDQARARALIENDGLAPDGLEELCKAIRDTKAVQTARDHARGYAERAAALLDRLPPSQARESLAALTYQTIHRVR